MLDEEDGQAELGAKTRDELHQVLRLLGVHARRRLVEEQQLRAGGKRARDLEAPLVAVGEVLGELVADPVQPDVRQELLGPTIAESSSRRARGVLRKASTRFECIWECIPMRTFSTAVMFEEADVLERTGDARLDHVVGPGAAEDPEAEQEHLVPERRTIASRSVPIRRPIATMPARAIPLPARTPSPRGEAHQDERTDGATQTSDSRPTRRGRAIIARPLDSTRPAVGSMIPSRTLKNVVLPAPLGPIG